MSEDNFYESEETTVELDMEEIDLDKVLSEPVAEEEIGPVDSDSREQWQMTEEEDKILNELLEKKKQEDVILKTYKSLENKPSDEEINLWKQKFGDIYLVSLSERENFVFRALRRQEWRQLMTQVAKLPEAKKTEAIVMRGILYPKMSEANVAVLTAGAPDTIRNLILEASNFLEPERAVQLVRKL